MKTGISPKGLVHGFGKKKNETFPSFNFWQKTNKQTNKQPAKCV